MSEKAIGPQNIYELSVGDRVKAVAKIPHLDEAQAVNAFIESTTYIENGFSVVPPTHDTGFAVRSIDGDTEKLKKEILGVLIDEKNEDNTSPFYVMLDEEIANTPLSVLKMPRSSVPFLLDIIFAKQGLENTSITNLSKTVTFHHDGVVYWNN